MLITYHHGEMRGFGRNQSTGSKPAAGITQSRKWVGERGWEQLASKFHTYCPLDAHPFPQVAEGQQRNSEPRDLYTPSTAVCIANKVYTPQSTSPFLFKDRVSCRTGQPPI